MHRERKELREQCTFLGIQISSKKKAVEKRTGGVCLLTLTLHGTSHIMVEAVFRFSGSKHHTPLAEWLEGSVGSAALPVCGSSFR